MAVLFGGLSGLAFSWLSVHEATRLDPQISRELFNHFLLGRLPTLLVAACIFGQVTVNETMTARYVAPALRAKLYSVRFTVGFLGAAIASPLIGFLHEATGSLALSMLVLGAVACVTLGCAMLFPNRQEELQPELWRKAG